MRCAVNYAFANRQVIAHHTRKAFEKALAISTADVGLRTVYEVAHNIAKFETHIVDGGEKRLCVHRKGATRAFAPGHQEVPPEYRSIGQPVLIPGDMGRYSYVLTGTEKAMRDTFGSTCHRAGCAMSRVKARRAAAGRNILREMEEKSIIIRGQSRRTGDEEISEAYKNVSNVVDACALAGISRKVAQLRPIGCIKVEHSPQRARLVLEALGCADVQRHKGKEWRPLVQGPQGAVPINRVATAYPNGHRRAASRFHGRRPAPEGRSKPADN
jgi:tRNA-splicing ligase RtcB